jgi:hypothetical protein
VDLAEEGPTERAAPSATVPLVDSSAEGASMQLVDPQITSDVVAYLLPSPSAQVRAIRLGNAFVNMRIEACGHAGPKVDLDDTGDRYDQAYYADLDLVRRKGLAELPPPEESLGELQAQDVERIVEQETASAARVQSCLAERLPSYQPLVQSLGPVWFEETLRVRGEAQVVEAAEQAARCLSSTTGFELGSKDQIAIYLSAVDYELSGESEIDNYLKQLKSFSEAFVDCTSEYFERMEEGLSALKPALVERNRELLESLALEFANAGYVP